ncbi:aldo/keto reductase [Demequina sp. NBRC 110054]|uniref:aldo/keto reductase n=1 Tax=Demequina sp. NBRC 110054 TaxID=1570343 RepID=UPI0009FC7E4F|nr:aldo/keto reductase [Demequina sp. NBRC 110054]
MDTQGTRTAREIGGTWIAPLGVGAMLMGTSTPESEARRILDHFVGEVAPRFTAPDGSPARAMVDTADCYCWWEAPGTDGGQSEALLGRWLADTGARERVMLATKGTARVVDPAAAFSPDGSVDWEAAYDHFVGASREVVRESIAASLDRLGAESVDLYYVHVDDRRAPLEETVGALAGLAEEGRIGAYAWSNAPAWRIALVQEIARAHGWPSPATVQLQHSYLRPRAGLSDFRVVGHEHLDLARTTGMPLVAYSPVLKGLYSAKERRDPSFWAMPNYVGPDADARFAALDAVAAETGATGNQVALAWLMAQEQPTVVPLIGARTWDQYLECAEAVDVELTPAQVAMLDTASA